MSKHIHISKETLTNLYIHQHLTLQEIADIYKITRQGIFKKIKQYNIDTINAERFNIKCDNCNKEYSITRKRFRLNTLNYCSKKCYYINKQSNYKEWRQGYRIARGEIEKLLNRKLLTIEVVHHIDGNNHNNNINNLMLFPSNSEHISHHHKLRQTTEKIKKFSVK